MLSLLSINNFSVIKKAKIKFTEGLNIITGETGAGKTVMINALKILLGDKVNRDFFRDEKSPIYIEAIFSDISNYIDSFSKTTFDIANELIIRREVTVSKNKIYINNKPATLKELKNITSNLIEISGQFENQALLNNTYHLMCIDSLIENKSIIDEFKATYENYKRLLDEITEVKNNIKALEVNKQFIEFQRDELDKAHIDLIKDKELANKINLLAKREQFKVAVSSILNDLKYSEINAMGLIANVIKNLSTIKGLSDNIDSVSSKLEQISITMGDIASYLEGNLDKLDYNEEDLNKLMERKFYLDGLMSKYNTDLEGLLSLKEELSKKLDNFALDYIKLRKLENDFEAVKKQLYTLSDILNKERIKAANILENKIINIFNELELKNAQFKTIFKELNDINENGNVEAEFFVSTNVGFDLAPIKNIASGGELSRIMLALKEIFSDIDNTPTLIFDEIDTGISGVTAKSVANKLKNLAKKRQILAITHLPVLAAAGETHHHLNKIVVGDETMTEIECVDGLKRQEVLATMISGHITDSSLKQALELLEA